MDEMGDDLNIERFAWFDDPVLYLLSRPLDPGAGLASRSSDHRAVRRASRPANHSPLCRHGILPQGFIRGKDHQACGKGLTGQHAVKRVLVKGGQPGEIKHSRFIEGQG